MNERELNKNWFDEHREELKITHPNSWVAVVASGLIAGGSHYGELLVSVNRAARESGFNTSFMYIGSTAHPMPGEKRPIPHFKNEDQEREFWETHDSIPYFNDDDNIILEPPLTDPNMDY